MPILDHSVHNKFATPKNGPVVRGPLHIVNVLANVKNPCVRRGSLRKSDGHLVTVARLHALIGSVLRYNVTGNALSPRSMALSVSTQIHGDRARPGAEIFHHAVRSGCCCNTIREEKGSDCFLAPVLHRLRRHLSFDVLHRAPSALLK